LPALAWYVPLPVTSSVQFRLGYNMQAGLLALKNKPTYSYSSALSPLGGMVPKDAKKNLSPYICRKTSTKFGILLVYRYI
jgi:hypothetical protein